MDNSDRSQTLEILDRYYAALQSGDREAIGKAVANDIVVRYTAPPGLLPWAGESPGMPGSSGKSSWDVAPVRSGVCNVM